MPNDEEIRRNWMNEAIRRAQEDNQRALERELRNQARIQARNHVANPADPPQNHINRVMDANGVVWENPMPPGERNVWWVDPFQADPNPPGFNANPLEVEAPRFRFNDGNDGGFQDGFRPEEYIQLPKQANRSKSKPNDNSIDNIGDNLGVV